MATFEIPNEQLFSQTLKNHLECKIRNAIMEYKREALAKLNEDIEEWIAETVINILDMVSFSSMGRELVITVNTKDLHERLKNATP